MSGTRLTCFAEAIIPCKISPDPHKSGFLSAYLLARMRKFSLLLLLGLLLELEHGRMSVVCGQTPTSPSKASGAPASAEVEAETLISAGKIDEAITILSGIPDVGGKKDTRVHYLLGVSYYQKSDFARAIEHLSISVPQFPPGSPRRNRSVQLLGLSHYYLAHHKEALPYLEEAHQAIPDNVEISYVLGLGYIQANNPEKARQTFAGIFRLPPDSAAAHLINAQMMIRLRFEELAEKEAQRALEIDPKLPQANFMLGEMAIYHAEIDRGIVLLRKEIDLNPAYGMAYYRLGEALTRQQKWDEAIAPLQKSIWLNPYFSGPYIVLGKVYLKKQDAGNAENMLRRAVQMDPNNFSAHHILAQALQLANRPDEAKKEFEIAEKLRTND